MRYFRNLFTIALMASTLFTHAHCTQSYDESGWTEQINTTKVDSITFDQNRNEKHDWY